MISILLGSLSALAWVRPLPLLPDAATAPLMLTAFSSAAAWRAVVLLALTLASSQPWALQFGSGPAGPKSGTFDRTTQAWAPLQPLGNRDKKLIKGRGEGSRRTMAPRGGTESILPPLRSSQNKHGLGQAEPPGAPLRPRAVKRSLQRALGRATREGWTFYKGQLLTLPKISARVMQGSAPMPSMGFRTQCMPKPKSKRAALFTWNAGGLTSEIYNDLLAWLQMQQIDFAAIQGTRWHGERTWQAAGYSIIQSGSQEGRSHDHSGLLTLISDRVCHFDNLSYSIISPGRLMHVKCKIGHNSVDFVNFYQHPDTITKSRPKPMEARGVLCTKLDKLLHCLARRNILAGDFNCPLVQAGQRPQHAPADTMELMEITKKYYLCSVTTQDPRPTYISPQGSTCIDFIFVPQAKLDAHGRLGRTLPEFPVASWRPCRDHVPVVSSVSLGWKCWYHQARCTHQLPKTSKQVLYDAWKDQTSQWTVMQASLSESVQATPPSLSNLPALQSDLLLKCHAMLRTDKGPLRPHTPHRSIIAQLWHSYGILKQTQTCSMQSLFKAWTHFARLHRLKRRLSQSCKTVKVQRLQRAVTEAAAAAQRHDTRKVFEIIRKLTPKQPFRAIRLRGPSGEAMPAHDECKQFEAHFEAVFQCTQPFKAPDLNQIAALPFTFDDLTHALANAPVTKAVGPRSLPNLLLRMLALPLAEWIWPALEHAWCSQVPSIPQEWRDAWLVLLAKRSVRAPGDVRPIALTDSIGRTILGLLTKALKPVVLPSLQKLPIFAFIPQRGTLEALMFVSQHCREVRQQCEQAGHTYWRQTRGIQAPPLRGGMMLSLDMSQAFDRLPRDKLATGFTRVSDALSQFFLH